jgi:predicted amidophosphoribosyltransferase
MSEEKDNFSVILGFCPHCTAELYGSEKICKDCALKFEQEAAEE